jgi:gamma-glutamyl:cysteine ligase YbdK (ATP-grasp superfamily)
VRHHGTHVDHAGARRLLQACQVVGVGVGGPAFPGTIELRVLDTPLHPAYAAALACYARELCIEVAAAPDAWPGDDSRELYAWNRLNAAKDGVEANWINPCTGIARRSRRSCAMTSRVLRRAPTILVLSRLAA